MRAGVAFPLGVNNVMIKNSVTIISNEDCSNIIDNAEDPDDDDGTPYMTALHSANYFSLPPENGGSFCRPFASTISLMPTIEFFFCVMHINAKIGRLILYIDGGVGDDIGTESRGALHHLTSIQLNPSFVRM